MSNIVLVLGSSGSGKSFSLKNLNSDEVAIISPTNKSLPFKNKLLKFVTDEWSEVNDAIIRASEKFNIIVIDDFQYVMVNEFMKRIDEKGYGKFNDIASHAWKIITTAQNLPNNCIVYFLCHSEVDAYGREKMQTIGKMLDEVVNLQGLFDVVVLAKNIDGKFSFRVKSLGDRVDSVKAPEGMFETDSIPNDIKILDKYVDNFYNEKLSDGSDKEDTVADIEDNVSYD
jgi:hypothetical protein